MRAFIAGFAGGLCVAALVVGLLFATGHVAGAPGATPARDRAALLRDLDAWDAAYPPPLCALGPSAPGVEYQRRDIALFLATHPAFARYLAWWQDRYAADNPIGNPLNDLHWAAACGTDLRDPRYLDTYAPSPR